MIAVATGFFDKYSTTNEEIEAVYAALAEPNITPNK